VKPTDRVQPFTILQLALLVVTMGQSSKTSLI
jgi:hypothetical protein